MTHWVLVDTTAPGARGAVQAACSHVSDAKTTTDRVALLPFVGQSVAADGQAQAVPSAGSLATLVYERGAAALCELAEDVALWERALARQSEHTVGEQASAVAARFEETRALAVAAGCEDAAVAVITNGRVVSLPRGSQLTSGDLQVMAHVAMRLQPGERVLDILTAAQSAARNSTAGDATAHGIAAMSGQQLSDLALVAASAAIAPPEPSGWGGAGAEQALFRSGNLQHSARLQSVFARLRGSALFVESAPERSCSDTRLVIQVCAPLAQLPSRSQPSYEQEYKLDDCVRQSVRCANFAHSFVL